MVSCDQWQNGTCGVIAELTTCERSLCIVPDEACAVCLACETPKALNRVTASIGLAVAKRSLKGEELARVRDKLAPAITIEKPQPISSSGPGTELKKLLGWLGFKPSTGCSCGSRQREMDHRGVQWCTQNIETIVGWLEEEAKAQSLPFFEMPARALIRYAIRRANK